MFDTVSRPRPRKPAAGTAVSISVHVLVIGAAVWLSALHVEKEQVVPEPPIRLFPGPQGAPAPGPGPRMTSVKTGHAANKRPRPSLMQPTATPAPQPAPATVDEAAIEDVQDAASGGELPVVGAGSSVGGPGGSGSGSGDAVDTEPRLFDETRMTPPQRLSGPDPAYTALALEHEVEGSMAVRCVVTEQGMVRACRVVKGLPYMDAAVVQALERRRYTPARIAGQPVAVDYVFRIELRLP